MAVDHFIDGDGWISDDSDFNGDERTCQKLEKEATCPWKRGFVASINPSAFRKVKLTNPEETPMAEDQAPQCRPASQQDILGFLRSRPQLQRLAKTHNKELEPRKQEAAWTVAGKLSPDFVTVKRSSVAEDEWRQDETIEEFLRRVPVANPASARVGPWLWAHSSKVPYKQAAANRKHVNMAPFSIGGEAFDLLQACRVQRAALERRNPGKEEGTITRKMGPHRDRLEIDLLKLAVENNVTSGKWMFFPSPQDLPNYWRIIAVATSQGRLGPVSKVGTYNDSEPNTLICVYTYDFSDIEDVRRVLNELVDRGLVAHNSKPIHYKCDAYTHVGLTSGNPYKLRASLYSSKEILQNDAEVLQDGPVARLKKRNKKVDDFYNLFAGDDVP